MLGTVHHFPVICGVLRRQFSPVKIGLAALSFASFWFLFSFQFSMVVMALIAVHESGHLWAMEKARLKNAGIYFIPFIGGVAIITDEFSARAQEAWVALMGPLWGLVMTLVCAMLYVLFDWLPFGSAAVWMGMVNLINLMPVNPLDGGRVLKSVAFSIHARLGIAFLVFGLVVIVPLCFMLRLHFFGVAGIIGTNELLYWKQKSIDMLPMASREIALVATVYVGTVCLFVCCVWLLLRCTGSGILQI